MSLHTYAKPLLFITTTVCFISASAQINTSKYEIGLKAGIFIYQGDLTPSDVGSYKTIRPQFGIFANRLLSQSFAIRINFDAGSVHGDDAKYNHPSWRRDRSFRFSSPVYELSAQLVLDILGRNYDRPVKSLSPYVFAGAGISYISAKRDFSRMNAAVFTPESDAVAGLARDIATVTPRIIPVFPVGIGFRYALTKKISIIGESSYRFIPTDYLDGFSYSANPSRNDHYYSHSVGAVYSFGKKNSWDCPPVAILY